LKISKLSTVVKKTTSLCPICLCSLDASILLRGGDYFLKKTCPEHGGFSTVIWRGTKPSLEDWSAAHTPTGGNFNCPEDCGLCSKHLQSTCCALVEVTNNCNLSCPICFAGSCDTATEPTLADLTEVFKALAERGNTFVQLSGGEPATRADLPEIIAAARAAGLDTVQLNTNGIKLGTDPGFTKALKSAGLSFVFMQFDGTRDDIHTALRGTPLLHSKMEAIRACGENILGVSLVPTIVPGINDNNIGDIISFGIKNSPVVRGVHFQPVSYFGRYPKAPLDADRITLPELLRAIETQTDRKFTLDDFAPSSCDHPRCGFHGDFVVLHNEEIMKLTKKSNGCCAGADSHLKNRNFVARRWTRSKEDFCETPLGADFQDMTTFLSRVKTHGFTITSMAFQDAYTFDFERLRRCSLHVAQDGKLVPFCAKYLTGVT